MRFEALNYDNSWLFGRISGKRPSGILKSWLSVEIHHTYTWKWRDYNRQKIDWPLESMVFQGPHSSFPLRGCSEKGNKSRSPFSGREK